MIRPAPKQRLSRLKKRSTSMRSTSFFLSAFSALRRFLSSSVGLPGLCQTSANSRFFRVSV
jgi:hypothetical protein